MIDLPDLDPQDTKNRVLLRDQHKHIRATMYGSTRQVRLVSQAAGHGSRFIEDCETTTQWSVRRVSAWSRLLEHRFRMSITGLAIPEPDLSADLLRVAVPFGGLDEDSLHLLAVVDDLARYRTHHGITFAEVGKRVGVDGSAVRGWEDQPARLLLKTVQRYTRGLGEIAQDRFGVGGHLQLEVVPVSVAVPV